MFVAVAAAVPAPALAKCEVSQIVELKVTMAGTKPMTDARINGKDVQFIVDSGAFYSTISPGSAAELGLKLGDAPPGFQLRGIGGTNNASVATVKEFILAGVPLHNIQFIVGGSEVGRGAGLLGQNVLGLADVEYDMAHGAIRLMHPKDCGKTNLAYWAAGKPVSVVETVPRSPQQTHTIGTILINGVKIRAVFDTGAGGSLLSLEGAARAGIKPDSPGVVAAGFSRGLGRKTVQTWIAPFASVKIGDEEIRRTKLRIGAIDLNDADMLIGADFFLSHRVYVANGERKLFFTYDGGPVFNITPNRVITADGTAVAPPVADADPTDAEGFSRRGAAFAGRREFDRAIADFSRATELGPTESRYFYQRAMARLASRQPFLAMADLDRTLVLKPDNVDAHLARARLRLAGRDRVAATEDMDAADKLLSPASDSRLELGALYGSVDGFAPAIAQYDQWIRVHPDDSRKPSALNGRCWIRAQTGRDLDQALSDCNAAIKQRPGTASFLDSRGLVRLQMGDLDKAIADYTASIALAPKSAWSLYGRGLAERRKGLSAQADADIAAATAISPGLPDRARKLGIAD